MTSSNEEYLTCPACGLQMRAITTQHIRKHGFACARAFKEKFGVKKLRCSALREKQSRFMSENSPSRGGHTTEALEKMSANRRGRGLGKSGKYERTSEIRARISRGVSTAHLEGRLRGRGKWVWSDRIFKKIWVRSSWEERVVRVLDLHPCVENYEYEPFSIPYTYEGETKLYIPDFKVYLEGGVVEIWEVKPEMWWGHPKNKSKWEALRRFCDENDFNALLVHLSRLEEMERRVSLAPLLP